jgi:hypothetical protein
MRHGWFVWVTLTLACTVVAGPVIAGASSERFKQSGMNKYMRKNYSGAVADFDKYLTENPSDQSVILLRGLSKSLLKPEDVAGACADFLLVKSELEGMNAETYCAGQPGW